MPDHDEMLLLRRARNFRLVWTGQVVSEVGDGMQKVALLWWARHEGGNGLLTAVALAAMLPVIVASPLGGWLADRRDRRRLMIAADVLRLVVTGVLSALVWTGHDQPVIVIAGVALVASGTAVFDPTYSAVVPLLVEDDELHAANGLNMANGAVGGLIGPLIGGVMIGVFSIATVLIVNAATFAWSAVCIARATVPRPTSPVGAGPADADAITGGSNRQALAFVLADRTLRRLLGLTTVLNMVVAPLPLLVVALAVDRFHRGSVAYGVLDVMISLGVLVGSLTVGRLRRVSLAAAALTLSACLVLAGVLPYAGTAAAFAIGGVAIAVTNTILLTRFQSTVPAHMHGRLFGAIGSVGLALRPAGLAVGAPLLAIAGVRRAFGVVAAGIAVSAVLWAGPLRTATPPAPVAEPDPLRVG